MELRVLVGRAGLPVRRSHDDDGLVQVRTRGVESLLLGPGERMASDKHRAGSLQKRIDSSGQLRLRAPDVRHDATGFQEGPARLNRRRMPAGWVGGAIALGGPAAPRPESPSGTLLARTLWSDLVSDNLPDLLRYEDRNSMAFSIEARVPFLDHRLAEAALLLPDRLKIAGRYNRKIVLREAMRGIVPDSILARRDKVAFQPPEKRWLKHRDLPLGTSILVLARPR